jgi:signal transduction histidine kinase
MGASLLLATWSFLYVAHLRRRYDAEFSSAYQALASEHEARTEALARSQAFTERLFDALHDRVVVIDRSGRMVKANRVALEAFGPGALGKPCALRCGEEGPLGTGCVAMAALRQGRPILGAVTTDRTTGRVFQIEAYPVSEPETGREVVIETARDVTDLHQYEARLREQEKLAAVGMLAAGIAHDIGNPLASISSELELLEGEEDLEQVRRSTSVVRRHIDRISRTLREMTDFARRRGEQRSLVSVATAVDDALRMVRHDPRARRISFERDVPRALPEIHAAEDQVVMILVNLLLNAFDAMPRGGEVAIGAAVEAGALRLWVRDTGEGMSEEVRRRAVEPLFSTKEGRGTGLGLTVTDSVMRSLGGSLELASREGAGTTVSLRFPLGAAGEVARA